MHFNLKNDKNISHKDEKKSFNKLCDLEESIAADSFLNENNESKRAERVLALIALLTLIFISIEVIGGWLAHSLAIMTDAFHMISDLSSFIVSILAIRLSRRQPNARHSYGFQRAEVLGALSSVLVIWVLTGMLLYMAVWRIIANEYDVKPDTMMLTAGIGVLFNLLIGTLLHIVWRNGGGGHSHIHGNNNHNHSNKNIQLNLNIEEGKEKKNSTNSTIPIQINVEERNGSIVSIESTTIDNSNNSDIEEENNSQCSSNKSNNLNIRAAFVHVLGDLCQSLGVLIASIIIKFTGFAIADPICTFFFSFLVLLTSVPVFTDAINILMEASPQFVSHDKISTSLLSLPNVVGIHSLRVWALKSDTLAATVHLELSEHSEAIKVSIMAQQLLAKVHRIRFSTVQSHCNQFNNKNALLIEDNENNKESQKTTKLNGLENFTK
ncbi:hypothetical protein ACQ4LE_008331 [Meloidogyne hapla]|uniref:ZT_dimer domain-containing protein n=1 Tax=Meloidogyne hapla TaxID=6305 RepID=A0A1I8BEC0_MELHA